MIEKTIRKNILVLTPIFPRSKNDHGSQFVYELSQRISVYLNISILRPHSKNNEQKDNKNQLEERVGLILVETICCHCPVIVDSNKEEIIRLKKTYQQHINYYSKI